MTMTMPSTFDLHICAGCNPARDGRGDRRAPWQDVLRSVIAAAPDLGACRIAEFPCLGGCGHRARFSVAAPGRWSILFGGLSPEVQADDLVAFLRAWLSSPDGLVPKQKRPAGIAPALLGRVPPANLGRTP